MTVTEDERNAIEHSCRLIHEHLWNIMLHRRVPEKSSAEYIDEDGKLFARLKWDDNVTFVTQDLRSLSLNANKCLTRRFRITWIQDTREDYESRRFLGKIWDQDGQPSQIKWFRENARNQMVHGVAEPPLRRMPSSASADKDNKKGEMKEMFNSKNKSSDESQHVNIPSLAEVITGVEEVVGTENMLVQLSGDRFPQLRVQVDRNFLFLRVEDLARDSEEVETLVEQGWEPTKNGHNTATLQYRAFFDASKALNEQSDSEIPA